MTNEELVQKIQLGDQSDDYEALLYKQCRRFISKCAQRFLKYEELEDLEQIGYIGMREAVGRYDPEHGASFLTYAKYYINLAMIRHIQSCGKTPSIPAYLWDQLIKLDRTRNEITKKTGKKPSQTRLLQALQLSPTEMRQLLKAEKLIQSFASLNSPIDEDGNSLEDIVADPHDMETELIEQAAETARNEALWKSVEALPTDQAELVRGVFLDGKTTPQLAAEKGCSVTKINYNLQKCYLRIRRSKAMQPYAEERIREIYETKGMHGSYERFKLSGSSVVEDLVIKQERWAQNILNYLNDENNNEQ